MVTITAGVQVAIGSFTVDADTYLSTMSASNVGIGISTPIMKMDINGGAIVRSSFTVLGDMYGSSATFTYGITTPEIIGSSVVYPGYVGTVVIGTGTTTFPLSTGVLRVLSPTPGVMYLESTSNGNDNLVWGINPYGEAMLGGAHLSLSMPDGDPNKGSFQIYFDTHTGIAYLSNGGKSIAIGYNSEITVSSNSGNIGINNINPQEKLDVNGNIKASGSVSASSATFIGLFVTTISANGGATHNIQIDANNVSITTHTEDNEATNRGLIIGRGHDANTWYGGIRVAGSEYNKTIMMHNDNSGGVIVTSNNCVMVGAIESPNLTPNLAKPTAPLCILGLTSQTGTALVSDANGNVFNSNQFTTLSTVTYVTNLSTINYVRRDGDTMTGQLNTLNVQTTGYIDLLAIGNPASPSAGVARMHSATANGFTRIEEDNESATNTILCRDNVFIAKNTTVGTINKGQAVYITGSTGNVPNIGLAKADSSSTLPAVGVALDSINSNNFGQVMKLGVLASFNTSSFSTGNSVWVSTSVAGALQNIRPTYPFYVQRIGSILVSGVGNGSVLVTVAPFIGGMESGTNSSTFTVVALKANGDIILKNGDILSSTSSFSNATTLNNRTYDAFVDTFSAQNIKGIKTHLDDIVIGNTTGDSGSVFLSSGNSVIDFADKGTSWGSGMQQIYSKDGNEITVKIAGTDRVDFKASTTTINNITQCSTLTVSGFTTLGNNAPNIKMLFFSTVTADSQGGFTSVSLPIDYTKIISMSGIIQRNASFAVTNSYTYDSGNQFDLEAGNGIIYVGLSATNSANIFHKPVSITIIYKE